MQKAPIPWWKKISKSISPPRKMPNMPDIQMISLIKMKQQVLNWLNLP